MTDVTPLPTDRFKALTSNDVCPCLVDASIYGPYVSAWLAGTRYG